MVWNRGCWKIIPLFALMKTTPTGNAVYSSFHMKRNLISAAVTLIYIHKLPKMISNDAICCEYSSSSASASEIVWNRSRAPV